jgi:hypothetical protein
LIWIPVSSTGMTVDLLLTRIFGLERGNDGGFWLIFFGIYGMMKA